MSDQEENQFEATDSGSADTYPVQAGSLKKNMHAMLGGYPCKIVDYSTSKTGKHGHAKAKIVGIDIFTGKKYEDIAPTGHSIPVPVIKRTEYQVCKTKTVYFIVAKNFLNSSINFFFSFIIFQLELFIAHRYFWRWFLDLDGCW